MKLRVAGAMFALIALVLTAAPASPAKANEVTVSSLCGSAYGGTFVGVYHNAYTHNATGCYFKYLAFTYYLQGQPYSGGYGYTLNGQSFDISESAGSISGTHRLCNSDYSICSLWKYTSHSV